jgi:AraC family transcriptional regulator, exoenzyme S synthesis regulatory protein ExsA
MRVPEKILTDPYNLRSLKIEGCTVIESCTHQISTKNTMLIGEHLLWFVVEGKCIINFGNQQYTAHQGEGFAIQRSHSIDYEKVGFINEKPYESLMFFLKEDLIKEFLHTYQAKRIDFTLHPPVSGITLNQSMQIFLQSILLAFESKLSDNSFFLKNKLFELLFNLTEINTQLFSTFNQFIEPIRNEIPAIMEANFKENLTLEEFAYKAGRSLASFKRDFKKIYNTSPHQWLLNKRLAYARTLLEHTQMQVSDACYEAGFESLAHFSRVFKEKFGINPSALKSEPIRQKN